MLVRLAVKLGDWLMWFRIVLALAAFAVLGLLWMLLFGPAHTAVAV
jgi:hypothetical protein